MVPPDIVESMDESQPKEEKERQHIADCCENAPQILEELLDAQEVAGTFVAIQDAIDPNKEDNEAVNALSALGKSAIQFTVQSKNTAPADKMRDRSPDEDLPTLQGQLASEKIVPERTMLLERQAAEDNGSHKNERLLNRERSPNSSNGGKSRTRRRRPSTAKRTRRKAYNKKSNKRKSSKQLSRKQLSRRRQSRRK